MIYNNDKLIAAAFIKARAEIGGIVTKDAKGVYGNYATLAAISEATTSILAKHGLAIIQEAELIENGVAIETWLLHESGSTMQFSRLVMPLKDRTAQSVGSAMTYGRKYQWASVCGLAPDDDDGQAAQDAARNAPKPAQKAATPPKAASAQNDEGDVLFEPGTPGVKPKRAVLSNDQEETLVGLIKTFYGTQAGKEQVRLAKHVSKGAVSRIADLVPEEANILISGLQKQIAKAEQVAAEQTPEQAVA